MEIAAYGFAQIKECKHPPLAHASAIFGKKNGAVSRL